MRKTALMIGAMILAATPALAQDNNVAATTDNVAAAPDAMTTTTTNDMAVDNSVAGNDLIAPPVDTMAPVDQGAIDNSYAPAPAPKPSFPWGVLGLLGLIGLIPRKAR